MTRNTDLAAFVAEKHEISVADASAFVESAFALILDGLQLGEIVKVKGLGTFKVMQTKERESVDVNTGERILLGSKPKVIFTPDMVLRERVNAPFAGFSSVPLSDGVEVEAEASDATINEMETESKTVEAPSESVAEPEEKPTEPASLQEQSADQTEPNREDGFEESHDALNPLVSSTDSLSEETSSKSEPTHEQADIETEPEPEEVEVPMISDDEEPDSEEHSGSRLRLWVWILAILLVIALGVCGALLWKINQMKGDSTVVEKSVPAVVAEDTTAVKPAMSIADSVKASKSEIKQDTAKVKPIENKDKKEAVSSNEKATMEHPFKSDDPRVKLGAYYIVGTQCEVTVVQGQTFAGISRAYLGDDMECYMEVYNGKKTAKSGDKLLIPKLITKKAWRKKMNK